MTNEINTTDEWITSETDEGFRKMLAIVTRNFRVLDSVQHHDGQNWYIYGHPFGFSQIVESAANNLAWYRIKNPNYIQQPKRGEIWKHKMAGYTAVCFGDKFVFSDGGDYEFKENGLLKYWEFTGETTDLFDKLDVFDAGGSNE